MDERSMLYISCCAAVHDAHLPCPVPLCAVLQPPCLVGVKLHVPHGQLVAVVGPTGAGEAVPHMPHRR